MKKNQLLFLVCLPFMVIAQNVGIGTQTPNASAMLEVSSTSKGLLIPTMTEMQRDLIASPAKGLLIFQTGVNQGFYFNSNTPADPKWIILSVPDENIWKLSGNDNVNATNNFIGTTNKQPLNFRINNVWAGQLDSGKATLFGYKAGWQNEEKTNTGFGFEVLNTNSTGWSNTAMGYRTLFTNRAGQVNTAVGAFAAEDNSVGSFNTAFGGYALNRNTTANANTAIGAYALENNNTGDSNVAVGSNTLQYGSLIQRNTAVGTNALRYCLDTDNTAMGYQSLGTLQFGHYNTAVGAGALKVLSNNSSNGNTAVGYEALAKTVYTWNTAVGFRALTNVGSNAGNTAVGSNALDGNTDGDRNTALGYYTEIANGGKENATVLGYRSFAECSDCLILGSVSGKNSASATVNVGIGTTNPLYRLQVGTAGDGSQARANAWNIFSDERYKKDMVPIDDALGKIDHLHGYYYNWKAGTDNSRQVGLLAQEVEKVLPEIVSTDAEGYKSVDYSKMNALLLQAVKEQQAAIKKQQEQIDELRRKIK